MGDWDRGPELAYASGALSAVLIVSGVLRAAGSNAFTRLKRATPWLLALGLVFSVWEAGSAKFGWLPQPFFPPPHAILEVFADDWRKLIESIVASVKLEFLVSRSAQPAASRSASCSGAHVCSAIGFTRC